VDLTVRAMLFDQLVVDADQEERGWPMAEEVSLFVFSIQLKEEGGQDGDRRATQKEAGGDAGDLPFEQSSELIFRKFLRSNAIIHSR
jgi:hypothetical protein